MGVYDGHGGSGASKFLAKYLHGNIAKGLADIAPDLVQQGGANENVDFLVKNMLRNVFLDTDRSFLTDSATNHVDSVTAPCALTRLLMSSICFCSVLPSPFSLLYILYIDHSLSTSNLGNNNDDMIIE